MRASDWARIKRVKTLVTDPDTTVSRSPSQLLSIKAVELEGSASECPLLDACVPAPLIPEYGLCISYTVLDSTPIPEFQITATSPFNICRLYNNGSSFGCYAVPTFVSVGGSFFVGNYTIIGTTITYLLLDGPPAYWGLQFYGYLGLQLETLILRNLPLPLPFTTLAMFPKVTTLEISNTAITSLDVSPLHLLTSLNLSGCALSQSAANAIVAALVANGVTGGSLTIQNQATGPLTITGGNWTTLIARGWTIA